MLFSKENSDFLLKIIIKINPSVISCMRVVWRVLHKRTIAIVLLSHLSQVRVSQLSPRTTTFCIWLPFPYGLSWGGVQPSDPLLYPCYIFLCQLPTVNRECSSGVEAVGFQTLSGSFMQVDKGAVIEAKSFLLLFFQWQCCEHYLFELFDSIWNASPHR